MILLIAQGVLMLLLVNYIEEWLFSKKEGREKAKFKTTLKAIITFAYILLTFFFIFFSQNKNSFILLWGLSLMLFIYILRNDIVSCFISSRRGDC